MEIYLQYRKARGCSQHSLHQCRGLFAVLNAAVYVIYGAVEMLKLTINTVALYRYGLDRANTILTSALLVISVLEVFLSGFVAIQVINALIPHRIRKVSCTQICLIQYTAVSGCLGRALLDIAQIPLSSQFRSFQRYKGYGLYTLAFFTLLEVLPLTTLVYVMGIQTDARTEVRSNLISTQEDVFLASYSTDPRRSMEPL